MKENKIKKALEFVQRLKYVPMEKKDLEHAGRHRTPQTLYEGFPVFLPIP